MNNIWYITSEFEVLVWYKRWIAYYLDNIIEVFKTEKKVDNIIIISKSHTKKDVYKIWDKITIIPIYIKNKSILWKINFIFKLSYLLPRIIIKYDIKVVETQETHTPLLLYNYFSFKNNIKYIMRLHSPEWYLASVIEKKKWFLNIMYRRFLVILEKIFFYKSKKLWYIISSPSKALLNEIEEFYKIKFNNSYVIPNFIVNLDKRSNLKKDYCKKRFLYIWWLQIRKNTQNLLESIEKILSKHDNVEFILVWKIWENIIKEKIERLKSLKWFNYKWELYWKEKYELLEYSTYYIIPSWENYSMSMIEASLYKIYLITVDLWWNKEINKYNTIYKDWKLYNTLLSIINDKQDINKPILKQLNEIISLNKAWVKETKKLIFKLLNNDK